MIKKYLMPKNTLSLSLLRNSRLGILKLAVAAVKTRLQDFIAIFSFKAAALAVRGRQQLQKFCAEFFASQSAGSRRKPQKKSAKVFAKWLGCARL